MTPAEVLADLRATYPDIKGKVILTPKDIAPIIGKSESLQGKLRHEGRFKIPVMPRAKSEAVTISIYDLAGYLSDPVGFSKEDDATSPKKTPRKRVTPRSLQFWNEVDFLVGKKVANNERGDLDAEIRLPEKERTGLTL